MAIRGRLISIMLSGIVGVAPHSALAQSPAESISTAIEQLKASDAEWRREDGLFRSQTSSGRLGATEAADYAEFVAGLKFQLIEQCERVRKLAGDDALKDYECAVLVAETPRPIVVSPGGGAKTEAETQQALVSKLDQLEADIDQDLLKKQRELRETAQQTAAASGGGGGGGIAGGATGGGQSGGASGAVGSAAPQAGGAAMPGSASQNPGAGTAIANRAPSGSQASGSANNQQSAPITRVKNNERGSDDDVVARQLREAAERERDPVLKEKLWNEYNKYKSIQK